jgi:hypothetical protein
MLPHVIPHAATRHTSCCYTSYLMLLHVISHAATRHTSCCYTSYLMLLHVIPHTAPPLPMAPQHTHPLPKPVQPPVVLCPLQHPPSGTACSHVELPQHPNTLRGVALCVGNSHSYSQSHTVSRRFPSHGIASPGAPRSGHTHPGQIGGHQFMLLPSVGKCALQPLPVLPCCGAQALGVPIAGQLEAALVGLSTQIGQRNSKNCKLGVQN